MAFTYHDLKFHARNALKAVGLENAGLEAREILCVASGKTTEELLRDQDLYVNDDFIKRVGDMVDRRREGVPLAYVLGEWSFRELTLDVSPAALIPRQETEILAQLAIDWLREREEEEHLRVLDLCAGTGCVGLSIASEVKNTRVVLVDASPEALDLCRRNVRRNRLGARAIHMKGDALKEPNAALGLFDLLVCNPPYIPTGDIPGLDPSVRDFEPHIALDGGADGLDFYRSVTEQWTPLLRPGGHILYEVGIGQAEQVAMLMKRRGCKQLRITRDLAHIPRVVEGTIPYILKDDGEKNDGETEPQEET